jgi:hypothetical protein
VCLSFATFGVGAGVGVVGAGTVLWRALELGAWWLGRRVKCTICPARGGTSSMSVCVSEAATFWPLVPDGNEVGCS